MNKKQLIDFENWTVETFNEGKLKSPVHLSGSTDGSLEDWLIDLFKEIKPNDWVVTTYRSHYHALLKGVPEERLKQWILDNKSIHFMDKEYKIFSSAIVGGTLSIALGIALGINIQRKKDKDYPNPYPETRNESVESNKGMRTEDVDNHAEHGGLVEDVEVVGNTNKMFPHVYCFIGDTTGHTGAFWECLKYAKFHDLPITFIIEDNGLSTDTPTNEVWGVSNDIYYKILMSYFDNIKYIKYTRAYPHYGTGKFVAKIWENTDETKQKGF